jgi:hypothetical protein
MTSLQNAFAARLRSIPALIRISSTSTWRSTNAVILVHYAS